MYAKKKKRANKGLLIFVAVILGLLLVGLAIGAYFAYSFLNQINRVEDIPAETLSHEEVEIILAETDPVDEEPDNDYQEMAPEEVTMPEEPAEVIVKEDHVYNILLIGQDRRPGQGRQRSDAMILCTINMDKKTLVMTSFLRDTYVKLPDYNGKAYGSNRLNVPYVVGGMEMLDECMLMNFGIEIDHNIEVDFSGFEKIVDAVGGVDIELTGAEANHLGGGLKKGINRLNGEKALAYSRIRALDNDFGRTNRQRKVLLAIFDRVQNMNLTELLSLTQTIFPMITTDMSNADIVNYVAEIFPILLNLEITTQSAPQAGEYKGAKIKGMSVLVPDLEAINTRLRETIGS